MPDRILYVNHTSVPGGAEISLLELIRALDRARFEPLALLPGEGPLVDALQALGVPVHFAPLRRVRRTWNPLRLAVYWRAARAVQRRLREIVRREGIRLIHTNSATAQLMVGDEPRVLGVPCVWHCRDLRPIGHLRRRLLSGADRVIAVSRAVAGAVDSPKAVVVHNGVDAERFHPGESGEGVRRELGIAPEAPVIGMIAQWVPWKRHDVFLTAAQKVIASCPECRFILAGEDHFDDHPLLALAIRHAAESGPLAGRLHLLGQRSDVPAVLAAMDVLALPSEHEPFGRALIEAMAIAKPVVAARGSGPDDVVTPDCGILLAAPEADSMAAALLELIADPALRRRMGQAGRARVVERFTAQRTAAEIQAIYRELLA